MLVTFVLTLIAPDRPGLVEAVAAAVARHGGNWRASRLSRLGGQFAGIVEIEIAAERKANLTSDLASLENDQIHVTLHDETQNPTRGGVLAFLDIVGQDRPGILHQVSRALASHSANVEELTSEIVSAPIDGNMLFQAQARVTIPSTVSLTLLCEELEKIGEDLMVDVALKPSCV